MTLKINHNIHVKSEISQHYFTSGVSISQTVGVRQFETSGGGSYGGGTSQFSFGTSGGSQQGIFQQLGTNVKNYSVSLTYKEGKEKKLRNLDQVYIIAINYLIITTTK